MKQHQGTRLPLTRGFEAGLFLGGDTRVDVTPHRSRTDGRPVPGQSPAGPDFVALLKAFQRSGGTVPAALFGALQAEDLVERAPNLKTLVDRGDLFAFAWRGQFWVPLFQLDADRFTIKSSAREVRAALPRYWSGWELATWFAAPHELLENRSPVDVLDSSGPEVIGVAQWQSSSGLTARPRGLR